MKTPVTLCVWLLFCLLTLPAVADTVSVRLVAVSSQGTAMDGGLSDVQGSIKQLPFTNYKIVDSKSVGLPANGTTSLSGGIAVTLKGNAGDLSVTVKRGGSTLVNSTYGMRPGSPVINVIRSGGQQYLLILVVRN